MEIYKLEKRWQRGMGDQNETTWKMFHLLNFYCVLGTTENLNLFHLIQSSQRFNYLGSNIISILQMRKPKLKG